MYQKILLALDNSDTDKTLIEHVPPLAKMMESELLLLHVADGWVARNFDQLKLSASKEMQDDWDYLERTAQGLRDHGLTVKTLLALGNPPSQILAVAEQENCDLIAMASHGHRLIGDIFFGSTIEAVRHASHIPILAIPSQKRGK